MKHFFKTPCREKWYDSAMRSPNFHRAGRSTALEVLPSLTTAKQVDRKGECWSVCSTITQWLDLCEVLTAVATMYIRVTFLSLIHASENSYFIFGWKYENITKLRLLPWCKEKGNKKSVLIISVFLGQYVKYWSSFFYYFLSPPMNEWPVWQLVEL